MENGLKHLPAPLVFKGTTAPGPRRKIPVPEEEALNKQDRPRHAETISTSISNASAYWQEQRAHRKACHAPSLPKDVPFLVKVEPGKNLDYLKTAFNFEIVSENDDGFVIVCSEDVDLNLLEKKAKEFSKGSYGSGAVGKIYKLFSSEHTELRLRNVLTKPLLEEWGNIEDEKSYQVEISIECLGPINIPNKPKKGPRESEAAYTARLTKWKGNLSIAKQKQEELQIDREEELCGFIAGYGGEIKELYQDALCFSELPDSFTCIAVLPGIALKDFALNYPYVFEIGFPETLQEVELGDTNHNADDLLGLLPPNVDAPRICVIDSGIQENHILLNEAIDSSLSFCFIPGESSTDTADYVSAGGHGTRVAGAVLYGDKSPVEGGYQAPFWLINARILDSDNKIDESILPSILIKKVVTNYRVVKQNTTRVYNHSVNSSAPCTTSRMSVWAAEIDNLSWEYDVLVVQSSGNIPKSNQDPLSFGITNHLSSGKTYPEYLVENSCRIANPAQSMHALTVGSVAFSQYDDGNYRSLGDLGEPSSFSRTGLGLWGAVKADVVEYGGDWCLDLSGTNLLKIKDAASPLLVRSSYADTGPAAAKDMIGTSFSTPKVTHIAGLLQREFPDEPTTLYRALIANSARWPEWAEIAVNKLFPLQVLGYGIPSEERAVYSDSSRVVLVASPSEPISDKEGHLYRIPIPEALRNPAASFSVRIDVSLAYVTPTRRTRRHPRNYFGTWVDWNSSKTGETVESLQARSFRDHEGASNDGDNVLPWKLRERSDWGEIIGAQRSYGSLQKDWAVLPAHQMPQDLCIVVAGHAGWDKNSDFGARYSLAISIEAQDVELDVYQLIESEIPAMGEIESEIEVTL